MHSKYSSLKKCKHGWGLQEKLWRHSAQFKRLTMKLCRINMSCRKMSSNVHCFPELSGIVISQSLLRSRQRFPISLPQSSVIAGVIFCGKHSQFLMLHESYKNPTILYHEECITPSTKTTVLLENKPCVMSVVYIATRHKKKRLV